jgi:DNA-binding transcriptional regulator YiaG
MELPGFFDHSHSGKLAGKDLQKFRRNDLDLSQKGLADCLGVSVRTVQGWEIGKSKPMEPIVRLIKLFKFIPAVKKLLCPAAAGSQPS